MSQIQTPNGLEDSETLVDANVIEIYQHDSGGLRRNKKSRLSVLRDYFQKVITGDPGFKEIITANSNSIPMGSGISVDVIGQNTTAIEDEETARIVADDNEETARINGDSALSDVVDARVGTATGSAQGLGTEDDVAFNKVSEDGLFTGKLSYTLALGESVVIPKGKYLASYTITIKIQIYDVSTSTWIESNTPSGYLESDGQYVRLMGFAPPSESTSITLFYRE